MSTRATIHFQDVRSYGWGGPLDENGRHTRVPIDPPEYTTQAIVYRHSDGYPDGLGQDLVEFVAEVSHLGDTRLGDPSYLAAKWVVFDVAKGKEWQAKYDREREERGDPPYYADQGRLEFLGVGITLQDPGDIEYRYLIRCDGKVNDIRCETPDGTLVGLISTAVPA